MLDEIFAFLLPYRQSLASCTLVCHRWTLSSSRILLDTLSIATWTTHKVHLPGLAAAVTAQIIARPVQHLRMLDLHGGTSPVDFLQLQDVVARLPRLQVLCLTGVEFLPLPVDHVYVPPKPDARRSLDRLAVSITSKEEKSDAGTPTPVDVLLWFTEIQTFESHFLRQPNPGIFIPVYTKTHQILVRRLVIDRSCIWTALKLARLVFDPRSLTQISVLFTPVAQMDALNQYFELFGANIENCIVSARVSDRSPDGDGQTGKY